jgi:hypothetical protein
MPYSGHRMGMRVEQRSQAIKSKGIPSFKKSVAL